MLRGLRMLILSILAAFHTFILVFFSSIAQKEWTFQFPSESFYFSIRTFGTQYLRQTSNANHLHSSIRENQQWPLINKWPSSGPFNSESFNTLSIFPPAIDRAPLYSGIYHVHWSTLNPCHDRRLLQLPPPFTIQYWNFIRASSNRVIDYDRICIFASIVAI